jgi:hypothetical protein
MGRLETKVGQLDSLHKRHLARPSFDDAGTEETEIKALTREISEVSSEIIFSKKKNLTNSCWILVVA